jgi:hypothetical protein
MGIAELNTSKKILTIHSWVIIYGESATDTLCGQMVEEIETLWNEPRGTVRLEQQEFLVQFKTDGYHRPDLKVEDVMYNNNPKNNYFRIEPFAHGNISYVDGLGSNTGYFKLENLYAGSTTAAHEYGHTLGLDHPVDMDYRGKGRPGIMYARGTLVDAQYQYDPVKPAGVTGGTMHPMHRLVRQQDIDDLQLHRLRFEHNMAVVGGFTSIWHEAEQPR